MNLRCLHSAPNFWIEAVMADFPGWVRPLMCIYGEVVFLVLGVMANEVSILWNATVF